MQIPRIIVGTLFTLLAVYALAADPSAVPTPKFVPRISPQVVELRKKQAAELKEFYQEESKAKAEHKEMQAKEHAELLKGHREARENFLRDKHSAPERAEFFKKQRSDMQELRARQKLERNRFEEERKAKAKEFRATHRLQEDGLTSNH